MKILRNKLSHPRILEPSNPRTLLNGFTLIELLVVIFIISLTTAIIMPSFWASDRSILKTEARRISSTLRYINSEASGKKQTYLYFVNFDDMTWGFKSENESRNFKINKNVSIKDVVIPSQGEITRGELTVVFGPMGPEEPVILHLKKGEIEYTIIFNHISGRTKIIEGYVL